jgi:hypothetical protein
MILCTLGSVTQKLDASAEVQVVSATTGSYLCSKVFVLSCLCAWPRHTLRMWAATEWHKKLQPYEPTHLQGSVLKFEGVSRSLSFRRSHQLCAVAWNSLLYWRKLDLRVNVVQSHTVDIVHLSYSLDKFLFTSCIYAWFGFVLCIILFSLVSVPLTWVDNLSYLEAVTSINSLARYFLFCAASFVFSILCKSTHQSGF